MNGDFRKIMTYLKDLKIRYFHALSAFYAYEALCEEIAPNIVGSETAKENSDILNTFKEFFTPAKEALRVYFFIELAKIFDTSKDSLQINKIINLTESKIKNLTIQEFTDYNQDRELINELIRGYKGISSEDLKMMKELLSKHKEIFNKLKTYRDKWLAHADIEKPELPSISAEEIKNLFDTFAKVMEIFTRAMNHEWSIWNHVEPHTKEKTKMMIDHLKRFEPYRLREIEEESIKT